MSTSQVVICVILIVFAVFLIFVPARIWLLFDSRGGAHFYNRAADPDTGLKHATIYYRTLGIFILLVTLLGFIFQTKPSS